MDVLRILVLCQILVPVACSEEFERDLFIQLINIQDTIQKWDFDMYQMILNVPQKLAQNPCICGGS